MAQRFEWAHASAGFRVVGPDELDELAPDGNAKREYGVWLGDEVMVYGSLADLSALLEAVGTAIDDAIDVERE
jgi:hypothetical protein